MSPAAKSQLQIVLEEDVYGSFIVLFFSPQLEERHFIAFSLNPALGVGRLGKEEAVNIGHPVPVCGSWQHSLLLLRCWWKAVSLAKFLSPSPFRHAEINHHTTRNTPGGDGGMRAEQTENEI